MSASRPDWLGDYQMLANAAGYVPLARTQIEVSGNDRASWLHNLCTNEIKKLAVGAGCEAFFTNVQGKTLGHGFIFAEPEALVIDTVAGQGETLIKHLDRYLITEQVVLTDCSGDRCELLLAGPEAQLMLSRLWKLELPEARLSHATVQTESSRVTVRRADIVPQGLLISTTRDDLHGLTDLLESTGVPAATLPAFEALRIEQGTPLFGVDITDKNLPQEVARDQHAISFVKGCYLGQETVARIDALGHVNKLLVGVKFSGEQVPRPGTELTADGGPVGSVTSAAFSPRLSAPLALAYVRSAHAKPGTTLSSELGAAEVVALPLH